LWLLQRTAFGTSKVNPALAMAGHGGGHGPDDDHGGGGQEHAAQGGADAGHGHDDDHGDHERIHDVNWTEWLAWTPLLALILALGVYPNIVFKATDPAVKNSTLQEECLQDYVEADCASVFKPKHNGNESTESVEGE
jgi:NADH:ubiquinone oxidoreductase subunit 4 (subunit M)